MNLEKYNNILTGFSSNIVGNILMFATTIFLTRMYPPEIYGEFRFVFSLIALVVIVLLFGRDNGIIYFSQDKKVDKNTIIKEEVIFGLTVLTLGTLFLYIFSSAIVKHFFSNVTLEYFQLSLIMIPLWGFFNLLLSGLKVKGMVNYSFLLSNLTQRALRVPFFIFLTLLSTSYYSLALGMILSQVVLVYLAIKKIPFVLQLRDINIKDFFKRFSYSAQLGINAIIVVLLTKIDVIMVGKYTDNTQVAIYDTCVMLSFVIMLPFIALVKSSEPVMKGLVTQKNIQKKYTKDLKLAIELSLGILLFYFLADEEILHIFGEVYVSGADAFLVLSISYMLVIMLGTPIELLNMNGFTKVSTIILVSSIFINIGLNHLLIPLYGIVGAGIATGVSLIFSKIIGLVLSKKYFNSIFIQSFFYYKNYIIVLLLFFIFRNFKFDDWFLTIIYALFVCIVYFVIVLLMHKKYREVIYAYLSK